MIGVLAALAGCRRAAPPPPVTEVEAHAEADAAPHWLVVRPAIRCAECHGKMHAEWVGGAHAKAETSPLYRVMRAAAPPALGCDRCHAPLAPHVEPGDRVVSEGVTCEVCHSIHTVEERPAGFTMALSANVQRGPICDAKDHYFHKMGCSPLHAESKFCAGCHILTLEKLPVLTDYEEWKSGPYGEILDCQDCHMPRSTAEVAEGSPAREGVSSHGFRPIRAALIGSLVVTRNGGALDVEVDLRNAGAAHLVPGGFPGRQLLVRVMALDKAGGELARGERIYERRLVDAAGKPAPFYAAAREEQDTRLRPKEDRVEQFTLPALGAAHVRLQVARRAISPEVAAAVGWAPEPETILVQVEAKPGATVDWRQ